MRNSSLAAAIIAATFCMTGAPGHAEVSWSDLLQDPDNAALNQQFVASDWQRAISRQHFQLLKADYSSPTDVQLRLLRAEILVNLANDTLALGELDALAKLPLLPEQKAKIEQLQDVIDGRTKTGVPSRLFRSAFVAAIMPTAILHPA